MSRKVLFISLLMLLIAGLGAWAIYHREADVLAASEAASRAETQVSSISAVPSAKLTGQMPKPAATTASAQIAAQRERWQAEVRKLGDSIAQIEYCRSQVTGQESLWCVYQVTRECMNDATHRLVRGQEMIADIERQLIQYRGRPAAEAHLTALLASCRSLWLSDPARYPAAKELLAALMAQKHPLAIVEEIAGFGGTRTTSELQQSELRDAWRSGDPDAINLLLQRCIAEDASAVDGVGITLALIDCRLRGNCKTMPQHLRLSCQMPEFLGFCPHGESERYEEWLSQRVSLADYRDAAAFADATVQALATPNVPWPPLESCLSAGQFGN